MSRSIPRLRDFLPQGLSALLLSVFCLSTSRAASFELPPLNTPASTEHHVGKVVWVDAGYYEPYGYDYGGWGHGYRVGPGRGGDRRGDVRGGGDRHGDVRGGGDRRGDVRGGGDRRGDVRGGGDRHGDHASRSYRPASPSRRTPSIPNRSRDSRH